MEYQNLIKVIDVIKALRDPKTGCPWDLKQNHQSLLKYLTEESYEFIHAVEHGTVSDQEEELGDVLLQVLLHSQIASESNSFNIDSVAKVLAAKMIQRHPHVFSEEKQSLTSEQVSANWQSLKKESKKKEKSHNKFHINIEDAYAPALKASEYIGAKSRDVNFDWDNIKDVLLKVEEELQEVKDEMYLENNKQKTKEELGDLLFSVAQLARHLDVDPEEALREANLKFIKRINKVENAVLTAGKQMNELSTEELELVWQKIKLI